MQLPQQAEVIKYLKFFQMNSLFIDNAKYLEKHDETIKGPTAIYTTYGLLHENWIREENWVGLADFSAFPSYWQVHTSVDIGVRRYHGTEAQVKSDLQYYNKDFIEDPLNGYVRDTLIYQIATHGGSEYGDDTWYLYTHVFNQYLWWTWWTWEHNDDITPSELENLWYHTENPDYFIDVNPVETLILAIVCHGFYDNADSMANAWVDNGAEAFVGAIINLPVIGSDDYSMEFWEELCDNSGTIESATVALCDYYNSEYSGSWNLGDEWEILGNSDATEP